MIQISIILIGLLSVPSYGYSFPFIPFFSSFHLFILFFVSLYLRCLLSWQPSFTCKKFSTSSLKCLWVLHLSSRIGRWLLCVIRPKGTRQVTGPLEMQFTLTHTYTYTHLHLHTFTLTRTIYTHLHLHIHLHTHLHLHIRLHTHLHLHILLHLHTHTYSMLVCTSMYM